VKANSVAGPHGIAQTITINGVSLASTVITWDESIAMGDPDRTIHVPQAGNLTIRDVSLRQGASTGLFGAHAGKDRAINALQTCDTHPNSHRG
jgi:hypothetical protein